MITRLVSSVRKHCKYEGLCLPHSIVASAALNRIGKPATVMMIGQAEHFYIKTKDFGDIDVFPNYTGELKGEIFNLEFAKMLSNRFAHLVDKVVKEVNQ